MFACSIKNDKKSKIKDEFFFVVTEENLNFKNRIQAGPAPSPDFMLKYVKKKLVFYFKY